MPEVAARYTLAVSRTSPQEREHAELENCGVSSPVVRALMTMEGKWMLMLHGDAFLNVLQQSGRGVPIRSFRQTGSCRWRNTS